MKYSNNSYFSLWLVITDPWKYLKLLEVSRSPTSKLRNIEYLCNGNLLPIHTSFLLNEIFSLVRKQEICPL